MFRRARRMLEIYWRQGLAPSCDEESERANERERNGMAQDDVVHEQGGEEFAHDLAQVRKRTRKERETQRGGREV